MASCWVNNGTLVPLYTNYHSLILTMNHSQTTLAMAYITRLLLLGPLLCCIGAGFNLASAEDYDVDPSTGFRMERYRAAVPESIPGGTTVGTAFVAEQLGGTMVFIDVLPPRGLGADPIEGYWLITEPRLSIAGTHWLPEVGRGFLEPDHENYFKRNLKRLSSDDKAAPLLFFCTADCWQSWNAAKRAIALGYNNVHWYPNGTDGWLEHGNSLVEIAPVNFIDDTTPKLLPATANIELIDSTGSATPIGTVNFKNLPDGTASFSLDIDGDAFSDHFLSMRPFRCITGDKDWYCHLAYPYELHKTVSADDFTNLEYQLLFITKSKKEFGIDAWNGVYYELVLDEDGNLKGNLLQGDLNVLSSPPEPYSYPIDMSEFFGDDAHKQRFPELSIRP